MIGRLFRWLLVLVGLCFIASVGWVLAYKVIDPPTTAPMIRDSLDGHTPSRNWRPLSRIDPNMARAVITAEDAHFCTHHGFDMAAIGDALQKNLEGGKLHGGSTISQQTAKNAFLWPSRSWVRKGLEVYFTTLIELTWGKRRIMEVYLNIVETGDNLFGVDAASTRYFHHGADKLTRREAARLAAILPQPFKRSASNPTGYTKRYAHNIERWIKVVRDDRLDACLSK